MNIKRVLKAMLIVFAGILFMTGFYWLLVLVMQVSEPFIGPWFKIALTVLTLLGMTIALYKVLE